MYKVTARGGGDGCGGVWLEIVRRRRVRFLKRVVLGAVVALDASALAVVAIVLGAFEVSRVCLPRRRRVGKIIIM